MKNPRRSSSLEAEVIHDVAALYVDPFGPYPKLVEHWYDAERDATKYAGPWPVIAHPPCGPWGWLRHLYQGNDHDLAITAVEQVRRWNGVLEHPAHSKLFHHLGLPRPGELADRWGGYTLQVEQCDWGHPARKRTWLYIVSSYPVPPRPEPREPTHWASGSRTAKNGPVPPGIKVCSAEQRRRTPEAFARWLIALAAGRRS